MKGFIIGVFMFMVEALSGAGIGYFGITFVLFVLDNGGPNVPPFVYGIAVMPAVICAMIFFGGVAIISNVLLDEES